MLLEYDVFKHTVYLQKYVHNLPIFLMLLKDFKADGKKSLLINLKELSVIVIMEISFLNVQENFKLFITSFFFLKKTNWDLS